MQSGTPFRRPYIYVPLYPRITPFRRWHFFPILQTRYHHQCHLRFARDVLFMPNILSSAIAPAAILTLARAPAVLAMIPFRLLLGPSSSTPLAIYIADPFVIPYIPLVWFGVTANFVLHSLHLRFCGLIFFHRGISPSQLFLYHTQAGTTAFFYFNNPLKKFPLSTIHFFTHQSHPTSFPTRDFHNHLFSSQTPFHLFSLLHPIPLPALYQLFTYKVTTHRHPPHHPATSSTHLGTHLPFSLLLLFVNPTNITSPSFLLSQPSNQRQQPTQSI